MNKTAYHLHAVLVHQGQASGGHYWAYVRKKTEKETMAAVNETEPLEESQEAMQESSDESELPAGGREEKQEDGGSQDGVKEDREMEVEHTGPSGYETVEKYPITSTDSLLMTSQTSQSSLEAGQTRLLDSEVWLKFNDVSVIEVNWEEVKRESFGSNNKSNFSSNTSAYCLVYISAEAHDQLEGSVSGQTLTPSLQKYVEDNNKAFDNEVMVYDLKKQRAQSKGKELIKPVKSVRFVPPGTTLPGTASNNSEMIALASDAKRARAESPPPEDMQIDLDNLPPIDPLLQAQFEAKMTQKLRQLSTELPDSIIEPRLLTEFHYASICQSSETVRQAMLLSLVISEAEKDDNFSLSLLAKKELLTIYKNIHIYDELKLVQRLYHMFCSACYHCVQAVNEVKKDNCCLALANAVQSFALNAQICQLSNQNFALEPKVLGEFRARTLLEVSQLGTAAFNAGEVSTSLFIGNEYIVPSLKAFTQHVFPGDDPILEKVREEWCQCLDQSSLTEDDSDKLADLLVKIVEDYSKAPDIKVPEPPTVFDTQRLAAQFTNTFRMLSEQPSSLQLVQLPHF